MTLSDKMPAEMSAQDYDSFWTLQENIISVNVVCLVKMMVLLGPKILLICEISFTKHCLTH